MHMDDIAKALGGIGTFGRSIDQPDALRASILTGIPYRGFEALIDGFALETLPVLAVLRVPARTLARRKQAKRFAADESDRLSRLARIAALAEEVLGDRGKAGRWLQKPNRALGGVVPLDQLATDVGTREVEEVLGRIAYGVFS
jgi:putative toxin-antitoxin system antitoxin component (TIGR02293 family)